MEHSKDNETEDRASILTKTNVLSMKQTLDAEGTESTANMAAHKSIDDLGLSTTNQPRVSASIETDATSDVSDIRPRRASVVDMWRKRESEMANRNRKSNQSTPTRGNKKSTGSPVVEAPKDGPAAIPYGKEKDQVFRFEEKKEPSRGEDPSWDQPQSCTSPNPNEGAHARSEQTQPQPNHQLEPAVNGGNSRTVQDNNTASAQNMWKARGRSNGPSPVVDTTLLDTPRRAKDLPPLPTPSPARTQPNGLSESQPPEKVSSDGATAQDKSPPAEVTDRNLGAIKSRSKVRNIWLQRDASNREMEGQTSKSVTPKSPIPVASDAAPAAAPPSTAPAKAGYPSSPSLGQKPARGASSGVAASPSFGSEAPRSSFGVPPSPSPNQKIPRGAAKSWIPSTPPSAANVISTTGLSSAPQTPTRGSVLDRWNNRGQSRGGASPANSDVRSSVENPSPIREGDGKPLHSPSAAGREPGSPQFSAVRAKWAKFGADKVQAREDLTRRDSKRDDSNESQTVPLKSGFRPTSKVAEQQKTSNRSESEEQQGKSENMTLSSATFSAGIEASGTSGKGPTCSLSEAGLAIPEKIGRTQTSAAGGTYETSTHTDASKDSEGNELQQNVKAGIKTQSRRQMLLRRHRRPGRNPEIEPSTSMTSADSIDLATTDTSNKLGDSQSVSTSESRSDQASLDGTLASETSDPVRKKKNWVKMGQQHAARPKAASDYIARSADNADSSQTPFDTPARNQFTHSTTFQKEDIRIDTTPSRPDSSKEKLPEEGKTASSPQVRKVLDKKKYLSRLVQRATLKKEQSPAMSQAMQQDDFSEMSDALSITFADTVPEDERRQLSEQLTAPKNAPFVKNKEVSANSVPVETLLACGSDDDGVFGTPFYAGSVVSGKSEPGRSEYASLRVSDSHSAHTMSKPSTGDRRKTASARSERSLCSDILSEDAVEDATSYVGDDYTVDTGVSSHISTSTARSTTLASRAGKHLREKRLRKHAENGEKANPAHRFENSPPKGPASEREPYVYPAAGPERIPATERGAFGIDPSLRNRNGSRDDSLHTGASVSSSPDPVNGSCGPLSFAKDPSLMKTEPRTVVTPDVPRKSPSFSSDVSAREATMLYDEPRESSWQQSKKRSPRSPRTPIYADPDNSPEKIVAPEFVAESGNNVEAFRSAYQTVSLEQIAQDLTDEAGSVLGVPAIDFRRIASDINDGVSAVASDINEGVSAASQSLNQLMGGDVFSRVKITERGPSPVEEEIAIEVEYIEDSEGD